jgi:peptidoglycan hydrolase-like protein with peptidoglycan-binding domain
MGQLRCKLFSIPQDPQLEACLVRDSAHITPGAQGAHVKKIQTALNDLSRGPGRENFNLKVDGIYGPKTAAAVQAYKNSPRRRILGPGQSTADNIVGKRTIKSLDDEMDILENELPQGSAFVSLTNLGAPHDHSTCPFGKFSPSLDDPRVHHKATPINPVGTGRKFNIGGEGETNYLGFQDVSTRDPITGGPPVGSPPDRPFSEDFPSRSASDICLRDAPINAEIRKEINRLARPGCRLTVSQDRIEEVTANRSFLLSLGNVLEDVFMFDDSPSGVEREVLVINMRGDGRYADLPVSTLRIFGPGTVVNRNTASAQVLP